MAQTGNLTMQRSFAEIAFDCRPKTTKRQQFLVEMERVIPWARLLAAVEAAQPKMTAKGGRPAFPASIMLRIHFMQQWFALSDPGMEEALHDIPVLRAFAGLDIGSDRIPDESSILRFRHRLETLGVAEQFLAEVNALLSERGLLLRQGTLVDATLIAAPSSTKNQDRARDPEMHQTRKGSNWHFGMKAHIGVDAESGLTHTVVTTPANTHDVTQTHALLHGQETDVHGDAGYVGAEKREENQDTAVTWHIALRPGTRRALPETPLGQLLEKIEYAKARIRAKVEHPFRIVKRQFGYFKTRYRGLAKNSGQIVTLFALANLYQARYRLGAVRP